MKKLVTGIVMFVVGLLGIFVLMITIDPYPVYYDELPLALFILSCILMLFGVVLVLLDVFKKEK